MDVKIYIVAFAVVGGFLVVVVVVVVAGVAYLYFYETREMKNRK